MISSHFRVLELEKKKENVNSKAKDSEKTQALSVATTKIKITEPIEPKESDSSDDEVDDVDEYLDWRSKKAYK